MVMRYYVWPSPYYDQGDGALSFIIGTLSTRLKIHEGLAQELYVQLCQATRIFTSRPYVDTRSRKLGEHSCRTLLRG